MASSKMQELADFGQSLWLDYIDRPLLRTDKLENLIKDGLRGMTSNPAIFNNAISLSDDYDADIVSLKNSGKSTFEIYDALTIQDIQDAADQFKCVYDETDGLDGYVSLEINPCIAHEIDEQIKEGLRLHQAVNRANVMIKVPSTEAGLKVIEELTANGVSINATLIFSCRQYENVAKAYYRGLNRLVETTSDLSGVRSVASVFVSRIDAVVDQDIDTKLNFLPSDGEKEKLLALKGKAAVANSRLIFEKWTEILQSDGASQLVGKNANVQRVLWASTGTKNPNYSDIKYVTELISNPSVNTLPEPTLNAFLDHGQIQNAFESGMEEYQEILNDLKKHGVDINAVCSELLIKGVDAFEKAFDELFASIEKKAEKLSVS